MNTDNGQQTTFNPGGPRARRERMMLGITLMAVWLILTGLLPLIKVNFANSATILNVVAVIAGALILLGR